MPEWIIAYCGPAALPDEIWWRWNLDPVLLAALGVFSVALVRYGNRDRAGRMAGWSALGLMFLVFVSPLCALSSTFFSARVLHHVLLIAGVAPLLVLAFPPRESGGGRLPLSALAVVHAIILWIWHVPGIYTWGLASVPAYWLMQISLLGSAWALWHAVFASRSQPLAMLAALVGTVAQMGMLGALIVFAPEPLYLVHLLATLPWGVSPLSDQQFAGLLMWVPATVPYIGVGLWLIWSELGLSEGARW